MSYRKAFIAYLKENSPYNKSLTKQDQAWLYEFNKLLFSGTSELLSKQIGDVETYARIRREVFKDSYSNRVSLSKQHDKLTEYIDYVYRPVEGDEMMVEVMDLYREMKNPPDDFKVERKPKRRPRRTCHRKRDFFFDTVRFGKWTSEVTTVVLEGKWGTTLYNFSEDLNVSQRSIAALINAHRLQYFRTTAKQEKWIKSNRLLGGGVARSVFLPLSTLRKLAALMNTQKARALVMTIDLRKGRK